MKRPHEDTVSDSDEEDEAPSPKNKPTPESVILQDLERGLQQNDPTSMQQQLIETQKQYFTMYMNKLMHQLPMGKAIIDTVRKNGHDDDFMYMYTASKTIVQSIMSVKQHKAMKSMVDMVAGIACKYMHDKILTPMLKPIMDEEHLQQAFQAYQTSVNQEENDSELEMRCLLHTIHSILEKEESTLQLDSPFLRK
ncbi:hypothetical protein JTE90_016327 [Oedothorax gibbosus]|uniref:Uncharacterized protein n=1 Tax=Oedothorax gibbosus TaxID=931172 RepID=A0AAV6TQB4_9ARAC|nr:hypothetical protein JTE90_016327 [Oedothorax gibbosus]